MQNTVPEIEILNMFVQNSYFLLHMVNKQNTNHAGHTHLVDKII